MYNIIKIQSEKRKSGKTDKLRRGVVHIFLGIFLLTNFACSKLSLGNSNKEVQSPVANSLQEEENEENFASELKEEKMVTETAGKQPYIEEMFIHTPFKEESAVSKGSKEIVKVLENYENRVPDNIPFIRKYNGDLPSRISYGIIMSKTANVREEPVTNSKLLEVVKFYERVELLEKIELRGSQWYKVKAADGQIGYIFAPAIKTRVFQFDRGVKKIEEVETFIRTAKQNGEKLALVTSYTPDSENRMLSKIKDKYGRYKTQSATATYNGEKLYIPDRSIAKIVGNDGAHETIKVESMTEPSLRVDDGSVVVADRLKDGQIRKAIVVDIENQNFTLYEKIQGRWSVVSYSYSKTGYESTLGFQTPRGSFLADIGKTKMLYTNSAGQVEGYAYNAVRFSGGGYLHGTPVTLEESRNEREVMRNREGFLGTFPGTRKCIRTTVDHSRFVYSWVFNKESSGSGLPNYEKIRENILFVIY